MTIKIPSSLIIKNTGTDGYNTEASNEIKQRYHKDGQQFLTDLAAAVGVAGDCVISSNQAGFAILGEVTLHADSLYVQLRGESPLNSAGFLVMFRSCKGRNDYSGGLNLYADTSVLGRDEEALANFVKKCTQMASGSTA